MTTRFTSRPGLYCFPVSHLQISPLFISALFGRMSATFYWKQPPEKPLAVILAFHGLGDHILRYDHMFTRFAECGILVKGMDYRGHGRTLYRNQPSKPKTSLRGYTESFERVFQDMMLLYREWDEQALPTFVVGLLL
jgi:alpha-beta hydrolase superfamily lysophospholipase